MLEKCPFSRSIESIPNIQQIFSALGQPKQKHPPLPSHLLKSPSMSLGQKQLFFWTKNNSKVKKTQKVENFWKYLHSTNSELWVVVSFSWYFQKHLFTTSQADICKQLPTVLFFSVGAVTGGHAGRLSCLETPQHPRVAPVGMGRCISRKNVKFDKISGKCGWNIWKMWIKYLENVDTIPGKCG